MAEQLLPKQSDIDIQIQNEEARLRRLEDEATATRKRINNLVFKKAQIGYEAPEWLTALRKRMNWNEFKMIKELVSGDKLDIGHVVMVDDGDGAGMGYENMTFVRAVVDSYCGNDFSGYIEDSGKRIGWRKNVDLYKIIGKDISINKPKE